MDEGVDWTKRLQQIAKWALIGLVGLWALYYVLGVIFALVVVLGDKLGLWELSFG